MRDKLLGLPKTKFFEIYESFFGQTEEKSVNDMVGELTQMLKDYRISWNDLCVRFNLP